MRHALFFCKHSEAAFGGTRHAVGANVADLFGCEFRSAVFATFFLNAAIVSKLDVLGRRDPLQIIDVAILFVVVAVMNLYFVFRVGIRNESLRSENMDVMAFRFAIFIKRNTQVSRVNDVGLNDFYFVFVKRSYASEIAHLVFSFVINNLIDNVAPLFAGQVFAVLSSSNSKNCNAVFSSGLSGAASKIFFASLTVIINHSSKMFDRSYQNAYNKLNLLARVWRLWFVR